MAENLLNAEYLRSEIKRQFGTQSAFARHMGWSRQYLSQVLNGKVNVTLAQLALLSNALDLRTSSKVDNAGPFVLRETNAVYFVDTMENRPNESVSVVVANQPLSSSPFIDIGSLRRWSSASRVNKPSDSPQERLAFIRSLQEKYHDQLPSTELVHQYKQEEKQIEEQQNGIRA